MHVLSLLAFGWPVRVKICARSWLGLIKRSGGVCVWNNVSLNLTLDGFQKKSSGQDGVLGRFDCLGYQYQCTAP